MYSVMLSQDCEQNAPLTMTGLDTEMPPSSLQIFSSQMHYMQVCSNRVDVALDRFTPIQPRPLAAIPPDYNSDNFLFPPSSEKVYSGSQSIAPSNYPLFAANSFSHQFGRSAVHELQPHMPLISIKNVEAKKLDKTWVSIQEDDSSKYFAATRDIFKDLNEEMPDNPVSQRTKDEMKLALHPTDIKARTANSNRLRRTRIAEGLKALQSTVPCLKKGKKEPELDDVIDYIKFLKLQLKVLSQSRLSGEASPFPFVFLEGYGHYLICQEKCDEPLEETMSQLMELDMQAATKLLESKGLVILPMALACAGNKAS